MVASTYTYDVNNLRIAKSVLVDSAVKRYFQQALGYPFDITVR